MNCIGILLFSTILIFLFVSGEVLDLDETLLAAADGPRLTVQKYPSSGAPG